MSEKSGIVVAIGVIASLVAIGSGAIDIQSWFQSEQEKQDQILKEAEWDAFWERCGGGTLFPDRDKFEKVYKAEFEREWKEGKGFVSIPCG